MGLIKHKALKTEQQHYHKLLRCPTGDNGLTDLSTLKENKRMSLRPQNAKMQIEFTRDMFFFKWDMSLRFQS